MRCSNKKLRKKSLTWYRGRKREPNDSIIFEETRFVVSCFDTVVSLIGKVITRFLLSLQIRKCFCK